MKAKKTIEDVKEYLEMALGGNMNTDTFTQSAWIDLMVSFCNYSNSNNKQEEIKLPNTDDVHGKPLKYWKENATEDYVKTPISVLKYITTLEECLPSAPVSPSDAIEFAEWILKECSITTDGCAATFRKHFHNNFKNITTTELYSLFTEERKTSGKVDKVLCCEKCGTKLKYKNNYIICPNKNCDVVFEKQNN